MPEEVYDMSTPDFESSKDSQHADIFRAALQYVELGLPIIPLCPASHKNMSYSHRLVCQCPGKAPIIENWPKHDHTTEEEVREWFKRNKYINIGMPLGNTSGLVGIDVDGEHGELLLQGLSKGDLPETWEFTTGKGRRLLYKLPFPIATKKFRQATNKHQELAILCDGQQTVLPPSIHVSGKVYQWVEGKSPFDIDVAVAPRWVLEQIAREADMTVEELCDEFPDSALPDTMEDEVVDSISAKESKSTTKKGTYAPTVTEEDWTAIVPEGQRNNHLTKLAGSLLSRRNLPKEAVFLFLKAWNEEHCKPPLPEAELRRMIDTIAANEAMKSAKNRTKRLGGQDTPVFRPTPLAQLFINCQRELGYSWKYAADQGAFYMCDDSTGPWRRVDIVFVQKAVREVITDESRGGQPQWDKTHYVNEVVDSLKELLASPHEIGLFDIGLHAREYQDFICVENGLLYWRTGELKPWRSDVYTTIQLPVRWEEDADCPTWKQALEDWIPDEETRLFLQEYVGLCLIPDTSFRTAVFLYGSGANGKSLFLEGVKMLFGDALVSIPLHRIAERFEVANLQNKLINICGDIDAKYLNETGLLKALISGDTLRGEFKHGKSFDFVPVCRLMFSANTLPKVSDKTTAWYSRWKFVEFPRTFPVDSAKKIQLLQAFEREKPGILKWAVEGLRRLKERNAFTVGQAMQESARKYREENDSVAAFVSQVLQKCEHEGMKTLLPTAAVYLLYRDWCEQQGLQACSQVEFSKRAVQLGLVKDRRRYKGKSCMCFLGCKVNEEWQDLYRMYEHIR